MTGGLPQDVAKFFRVDKKQVTAMEQGQYTVPHNHQLFDITPYLRSCNLPWANPGRVIVSRDVFDSVVKTSPEERRIVPEGIRLSHLARKARYIISSGESEMSLFVPDCSSPDQREIMTTVSKSSNGRDLLVYTPGGRAPSI